MVRYKQGSNQADTVVVQNQISKSSQNQKPKTKSKPKSTANKQNLKARNKNWKSRKAKHGSGRQNDGL